MDWWKYILTVPAPRFIILKDSDHVFGNGALVGEVHANIFAALGCTAVLTNGAIRDLPGIENTGLQVFAGNVAVSHAYAHIVGFGEPVEVAGLLVKPGDLLHGDRHGVQLVPTSIAAQIPKAARDLVQAEQNIIDLCRSKAFSLDALAKEIESTSRKMSMSGCPPPTNPEGKRKNGP
jgi:regulator of RNase E activity RraA